MWNTPNTEHLCPRFYWVVFFWQTKSEKESLGTLAYTQIVVVGCMHHEKWVGLGTGVLYWTVRDGGLLQLSPVPFFLEVLENQSFPACHRHPRCKKCVHAKSTRAQVMTKYQLEYIYIYPCSNLYSGISIGDKGTVSVLD